MTCDRIGIAGVAILEEGLGTDAVDEELLAWLGWFYSGALVAWCSGFAFR